MMPKNDVPPVLARYASEFQPTQIESLDGAGGYSGARFWRLITARGMLCLRRWPQGHPDHQRLSYIHAVLQHVERQGFTEAAVPLPSRDGQSFVEHAGHFWELAPWMPGRADYGESPSEEKLSAALSGLARFHAAAATFPTQQPAVGTSPGLQQRLEQIHRLLQGDCQRITEAVRDSNWPELAQRARRLLSLFPQAAERVLPQLETAVGWQLPLQPCIRDVWHDHVLFLDSQLSGLVDFGAMRHESVAGDVARLLGSLAGDDQSRWHHGLATYRTVRPLSDDESAAVAIFDQSAVLLSGMNWLEWIYLEGRRFDDRGRIIQRLNETLHRLSFLTI